jgi:hypothetical protein
MRALMPPCLPSLNCFTIHSVGASYADRATEERKVV